MKLNKEQQNSLFRKYQQSDSGFSSYLAFRRTVMPYLGGDKSVIVQWCGMWLGIEEDGYTHS